MFEPPSPSNPRVVDGGCFVSSSDEMVVMDPCWMAQYLVAKDTPHVLLSSVKPGLWMVFAVVQGDCLDELENPSLKDDNPVEEPDDLVDSTASTTSARRTGAAAKSIRQLVLLSDAQLQNDIVTVDFVNSLCWESLPPGGSISVGDSSPSTSPSASKVNVTTGQVGVFGVESLRSDASSRLMQRWYDRACELSCLGDQFGVVDVSGGPVGVVCGCYECGDVGTHRVEVLRKVGERKQQGVPVEADGVWGIRLVFGEEQKARPSAGALSDGNKD